MDYTTDIKSHKTRLEYEKERAVTLINSGDYSLAALAVAECMRHKGAIDELRFQIERAEA